jgi:hypothetical protein
MKPMNLRHPVLGNTQFTAAIPPFGVDLRITGQL